MKALVVIGGLLLAARPAAACGVIHFGDVAGEVAKAFAPKTEDIQTPLFSIGGGVSTDGSAGTVLVGWGWGQKDTSAFLPGTFLTRVMAGAREDSAGTALSLTYGWYETYLGSGGLDIGLEHSLVDGGTGPIARLTFGAGGIAARIGGGYMIGHEDRFVGQVELVLEVMDVVGKI